MTNWNTYAQKHLNAGKTQEEVANLLVHEAAKDKTLAAMLLSLGARQVARNATTAGRRPGASETWDAPAGPSAIRLPAEAAADARRTFLDTYKLWGGTIAIGDATSKDLADSARSHDTQARGHDATAAFERGIGKVIEKSGKRVRDVMKADEVEKRAKERGL